MPEDSPVVITPAVHHPFFSPLLRYGGAVLLVFLLILGFRSFNTPATSEVTIYGIVTEVDVANSLLRVHDVVHQSEQVIVLLPETMITRSDQPATLLDIAPNERIAVVFNTTADGVQLSAISIKLGAIEIHSKEITGTVVEINVQHSFFRIYDASKDVVYTVHVSPDTEITRDEKAATLTDITINSTIVALSKRGQDAFEFHANKITVTSARELVSPPDTFSFPQ